MAGWGGLGGPLWYAGTHSGDNGRGQPGQQLQARDGVGRDETRSHHIQCLSLNL